MHFVIGEQLCGEMDVSLEVYTLKVDLDFQVNLNGNGLLEAVENCHHILGVGLIQLIKKDATWQTLNRKEEIILRDRKSTRLNSSHVRISYAVFCLKKKTY